MPFESSPSRFEEYIYCLFIRQFNYYCLIICQITTNDPKQWWKHIKEVVGLNKQNNAAALKELSNQVADGNMERLAEKINEFLGPTASSIGQRIFSNRHHPYT